MEKVSNAMYILQMSSKYFTMERKLENENYKMAIW